MSLNGQLERASVCFAVGSLLDWGVQSQKKAQAGGGGGGYARTHSWCEGTRCMCCCRKAQGLPSPAWTSWREVAQGRGVLWSPDCSSKKMKVGRETGSKASSLWVSPGPSSKLWPLCLHLCPFIGDHRSFAKTSHMGKSILPMQKQTKQLY